MQGTELAVVVVVVAGILSLGAVYINKGLTALSKTAQEKTDNAFVDRAIGAAELAATNVVKSLNQDLVDDLKEKAADGKLTKEEIQSIKEKALATLKSSLSDEVKVALGTIFGDLNTFLTTLLNATVADVKDAKKQ